jgi:hypothetical protein
MCQAAAASALHARHTPCVFRVKGLSEFISWAIRHCGCMRKSIVRFWKFQIFSGDYFTFMAEGGVLTEETRPVARF